MLRNLRLPGWTIPIALLLVCIASYGLLIPRLGFYWDDWPAVWFLRFFGPSSLQEVLNLDRPLLAWLYRLTTQIIGISMPGWQIFGLLARWVSCLVYWWTLQEIWPNNRVEITWATFLFAVYPGFRQQYIALIYSHDWIIITLFLLSLGLMIRAIRSPRWFWPLMVLSWLLSAYSMFADEYYFGLELLRPVLLWMVVGESIQKTGQRLRRVLSIWLPYIIISSSFLIWRLFIHISPRGEVQILEKVLAAPLQTTIDLAKTIFSDLLESGILAWGLSLNIFQKIVRGKSGIDLNIILAIVIAGFMIIYLSSIYTKQTENSKPAHNWSIQAILLGAYSLFIAGWPFWATSLKIELYFPWDRFNLAMIFGSCLLIAGLISLISKKSIIAIVAIAILIGLSVGGSNQLAKQYEEDWQYTKRLIWELNWRVPGLKPGTLILTNKPPFNFSTDNSITAPINWVYAPDTTGTDLQFLVYDVDSHHLDGWAGLALEDRVQTQYRFMKFDGSTDQAITLYYAPPNCVKILDPLYDGVLPGKPWYITAGAYFSDPTLIEANPAQQHSPPVDIFGPEPAQDWCYYFEKAELTRQSGDWIGVAELADQALSLNKSMTEANVLEWLPYIEAYALTDQVIKAEQLSMEVYKVHPKMRRTLCALWDRVEQSNSIRFENLTILENIDQTMACNVD